MEERYCYSFDKHDWEGLFNNVDDAISAAQFANSRYDCTNVYIGKVHIILVEQIDVDLNSGKADIARLVK